MFVLSHDIWRVMSSTYLDTHCSFTQIVKSEESYIAVRNFSKKLLFLI